MRPLTARVALNRGVIKTRGEMMEEEWRRSCAPELILTRDICLSLCVRSVLRRRLKERGGRRSERLRTSSVHCENALRGFMVAASQANVPSPSLTNKNHKESQIFQYSFRRSRCICWRLIAYEPCNTLDQTLQTPYELQSLVSRTKPVPSSNLLQSGTAC